MRVIAVEFLAFFPLCFSTEIYGRFSQRQQQEKYIVFIFECQSAQSFFIACAIYDTPYTIHHHIWLSTIQLSAKKYRLSSVVYAPVLHFFRCNSANFVWDFISGPEVGQRGIWQSLPQLSPHKIEQKKKQRERKKERKRINLQVQYRTELKLYRAIYAVRSIQWNVVSYCASLSLSRSACRHHQ